MFSEISPGARPLPSDGTAGGKNKLLLLQQQQFLHDKCTDNRTELACEVDLRLESVYEAPVPLIFSNERFLAPLTRP